MTVSSFDDLRKSFFASRGEATVKALRSGGFDARYFAASEEAVEEVLEMIPTGSTVGAGGSVTLRELGILDRLADRGDNPMYHRPEMDVAESMRVRKDATRCTFYLCSSNAVTMEGELVNTDGIGNRVSGMVFGPQTVIVLAGINKVVQDREEAFTRVSNVAAPANARRLGIDVPCVEKGFCVQCRSPLNICRVTTIVSGKPMWTDLKVFLIGESLGL
jgi:hypothetical protein